MIRKIKSWWRWRNTPHAHLIEVHDLTVLAARRCAYDLKHAAAEIGESRYGTDYHGRAYLWLDIFSPADGGKQYRHRLHHEIYELEAQVRNYREFLKERDIPDPYEDVPI